MRIAAQIDRNQPEIVSALRRVGCSVEPLHRVGGGVPDLLVGTGGVNYLIEVKDGSKPPSARALTADQVVWHRDWRGQRVIVESVEDALAAVGLRRLGAAGWISGGYGNGKA